MTAGSGADPGLAAGEKAAPEMSAHAAAEAQTETSGVSNDAVAEDPVPETDDLKGAANPENSDAVTSQPHSGNSATERLAEEVTEGIDPVNSSTDAAIASNTIADGSNGGAVDGSVLAESVMSLHLSANGQENGKEFATEELDTNAAAETSMASNDDTLLAEGDSELHFDRHGSHDARIVSAGKDTDTGGSFVVYEIEFQGKKVRHRYSHFDQLRKVLEAMFPALIVPPLPEKNSLTSYAVFVAGSSRTRADGELVEKRMRLLEDFLNRCLAHAVLREASPLRRFLDGETPWPEVMRLPPVSYLPTSPLRGLVRNPTDTKVQELLVAVPAPSSMQTMHIPDERFTDSEVFTNRFSAHVSGLMEQTNRRTFKKLQSTVQGLHDLAISAQGLLLTLEEQPSKLDGRNTFAEKKLTPAVAQLCKAFQAAQNDTSRLLEMWSVDFSEVLHLYGQFSEIIKKLLKFRLRRHLQYEAAHEALVNQRALLADLEATEAEVLRVDRLVESSLAMPPGTETPPAEGSTEDMAPSPVGSSETFVPITSSTILQANEDLKTRSQQHRSAGPLGTNFFGALSNTFSSLVEADPGQRRRESIDKSRQSIAVLEASLHELTHDLRYTCTTMQADLDRFQRQKVRDLSTMCLDFSKMHRLHAARNLEAWKEAKSALERMD